jgi:hypothetical protein
MLGLMVSWLGLIGCAPDLSAPQPSYDSSTRLLARLDVDRNRDGRIDGRTYMAGNRPLRAELDFSGDGVIDRWEYFDAAGRLVLVGTSSGEDGIEDTWTHAVTDEGERRVDLSNARDRRIDRREFYRDEVLTHAEEDVNGDGLTDKWDTYVNGTLQMVAFDTTYTSGRPDRRIVYDATGQFLYVEADSDGRGRFERAATDSETPRSDQR